MVAGSARQISRSRIQSMTASLHAVRFFSRRLLPVAMSAGVILLTVFCFASMDLPGAEPVAADHAAKMADGLRVFHDSVRSLLLANCFKCHGGDSVESGFNITDRAGLLKGGDAGVAVIAGNSRESLLYKLITHAKKPHMPNEAPKLPQAAIDKIAELD